MLQIGLREANQHFAHYIQTVESGEEILITRHGKPVAKLVPTPQLVCAPQKPKWTALQKAAWKRTLKRMQKGYDILGGERFNRDESHAR